jgi:type IV secretion system protein VirB8
MFKAMFGKLSAKKAPAALGAAGVKAGGTTRKDKALSMKRVPQVFTEAAADFERFRIEEIRKSRRIAWVVAIAAVVIAGIAVTGIALSFALKQEPAPVVLKVDNATGDVTMLRSLKDHNDHYGDVVNKYWLGNFVRTCERYDWFSITVDYKACELFMMPDVFKAYSSKIQDKASPLNVLKDRGKIDIRVISIVLLSANNAQVRFTSQKLNAAGENPDGLPIQRWIATIAFQYRSIQMTEQQRLVNPLGFKVLSYRVDPEAMQRQP